LVIDYATNPPGGGQVFHPVGIKKKCTYILSQSLPTRRQGLLVLFYKGPDFRHRAALSRDGFAKGRSD
jgi:hypothetical protein